MHPYREFDKSTNFKFNVYQKYILDKKGGGINGNNRYGYDFEINEDSIFVGKRKKCVYINIEKNDDIWDANIIFFGYEHDCAINGKILEKGKGTRHMFLWMMITTLKNFPNVQRFVLGDDTKIECPRTRSDNSLKNKPPQSLGFYYFLRYGKLYYQYYFDFEPDFQEQMYGKTLKNNYEYFLEKRKNAKISRDFIKSFYEKFDNKKSKYFYKIINEDISIEHYLGIIIQEKKIKYCDFFYELVKKYFIQNIGEPRKLHRSFVFNIKDKNEVLNYLHDKIKDLFV